MTLTELLIASILVGVVIVGALSADFAIRTWQKRIEQRTLVQLKMATFMEAILKYGKSAAGNDICISSSLYQCYSDAIGNPNVSLTFDSVANANQAICFGSGDLLSPGISRVCYTVLRNGTLVAVNKDVFDNAGNLDLSETNIFYGNYNSDEQMFTIVLDANGKITSIDVLLKTRPDPPAALDPLKNPEYRLTTSFLPVGLSQ